MEKINIPWQHYNPVESPTYDGYFPEVISLKDPEESNIGTIPDIDALKLKSYQTTENPFKQEETSPSAFGGFQYFDRFLPNEIVNPEAEEKISNNDMVKYFVNKGLSYNQARGLCGNLLSMLFLPDLTVSVGASGAIYTPTGGIDVASAEKLKMRSTAVEMQLTGGEWTAVPHTSNKITSKYEIVAKVSFSTDVILSHKTAVFTNWGTTYDKSSDNVNDITVRNGIKTNKISRNNKYIYTRFYDVNA